MNNCGIITAYQIPKNRDLLFFDTFISMGGGGSRRSDRQSPTRYGMDYLKPSIEQEAMEATYNYLLSKNLILEQGPDLKTLLNEAKKSGVSTNGITSGHSAHITAAKRAPNFGHGWTPPVDSGTLDHLSLKAQERLEEYESNAAARLFAILKSNTETTYTPIAPAKIFETVFNLPKSPVIHILLNALPVPLAEVPCEDILEFKQDTKVQKQLKTIQRWIRTSMAKEDTPQAIGEELADSLNDYTEHMRLARIKYNTEVFQALLTFPLATVERIIKLQFSQLFDPIFTVKKANIALCEAELKAPGRQLAYLHSVQETFGTR
ncbi:hypothetical protein [Pseudomonas sp. NMI1173_11]|uniref:hypothetical protein n=1 Tax=Pseudomonas sp. NMI1173_11 TaxID=2903145 RepID=UPI001E45A52F|nr:hypothetical protein [Pseudomonas sp. NMI1173_11]MCE1004784.1 hypothetical protein [Pseudomonas sp. NMI1173_11]